MSFLCQALGAGIVSRNPRGTRRTFSTDLLQLVCIAGFFELLDRDVQLDDEGGGGQRWCCRRWRVLAGKALEAASGCPSLWRLPLLHLAGGPGREFPGDFIVLQANWPSAVPSFFDLGDASRELWLRDLVEVAGANSISAGHSG